MQLPRGNLEAVRPRALVLPAVAAALDGGDYASAWALCAANRLDLNLLVDYHWPRFLQSAREFVRQVRVGGGGGGRRRAGARGAGRWRSMEGHRAVLIALPPACLHAHVLAPCAIPLVCRCQQTLTWQTCLRR